MKKSLEDLQGLAISTCPNYVRLINPPEIPHGCTRPMGMTSTRQRVGEPIRCKACDGEHCDVLQMMNPGEFREGIA